MSNQDNVVYIRKSDKDDTTASYHRINTGGGGDGGDMWQQSVETRLSELRRDVAELRSDVSRGFDDTRKRFDGIRDKQERDFRLIFGALIALALGLAGLMAKGFQWI